MKQPLTMKRITPILFLLFNTSLFLSAQIYLDLELEGNYTFDEIVDITEKYYDDVGRERGKGYTPFRRWKYWAERSLDSKGMIITEDLAFYRSQEFVSPFERTINTSFTECGPKSAINTSTWSSHIGRITAMSVDPNNSNHIVVGSASGGVWRTYDNGATWTPLSDFEPTLWIYSLEISHTNSSHYIAGTRTGIMYSTDAGTSWNFSTGAYSGASYTVIMDPNNGLILYAASPFRLMKSTDGGLNWSEIYAGDFKDIEFQPGNSSVVYASGDGILVKTTDSGSTFNVLSGSFNNIETIMLAVTPSNPNVLYVLQDNSMGGFGGLYKSNDGGVSFVTQADDSCLCNNILGSNLMDQSGQAPRDMDIVVSPINENEIHVGGIDSYKSTNGGASWIQTTDWVLSDPLPFVHADVDIMIWENNNIYYGTDGGLFYSSDNGVSFNDITQGLGIRQFYRIGVSETDLHRTSGGSQDNGTGVIKSGQWYDFMGADGMETYIDHTNADIIYGSIQYGGLYKSIDGGTSVSYTAQTPGDNSDPSCTDCGGWVTPLEADHSISETLFQGKLEVFKSTDGAISWNQISNFGDGIKLLEEITVAKSNTNIIYAAYPDQLFKTTNGGASWTDVTPAGITFLNINYISIHPTNPNIVSINLSGATERILETTNGGTSWSDISTNLPSIGSYCSIYEGDVNNGIYVGMWDGIYFSDVNSPGSWTKINSNLPNVWVTELEIRNGFLYVATYGRGLWKAPLATTCPDNLTGITSPAVGVSNSTCAAGQTSPSGGILTIPTSVCPNGSTLQYSTNGGINWQTNLPNYNQSNSITVSTRCNCDTDPNVSSLESTITTTPGTCELCPDGLASFSSPAPIITNSTCPQGQMTPTGGQISSPTNICPVGSTLQYSVDGENNWTTNIPSYNQTTAVTINTRCNCNADNSVSSIISSTATMPATCDLCPVDLTSFVASPIIVTNSVCNEGDSNPSGGLISAPSQSCPAGSILQYSTGNGSVWTSTLPLYDQSNSITVLTRCNCVEDTNVSSMASSVSTMPATCDNCPANLATITAPPVQIDNSICEDGQSVPTGGQISPPTSQCLSGSILQYSINEGSTWTTTIPSYNQSNPLSILTRCNCIEDNEVSSMTTISTTVPSTCTTTEPIPTMGEWGLMCLALLLSIFGVTAIKNQSDKIMTA